MSSFLILLATLSLSLFLICQADLISDVCSKSTNPSLCSQTLRSDPRSRGAGLRGLAQITIDKSKDATQEVISVAKSIGGEIASTCVETSGDAISDLNDCAGYLKGGGSKNDLQTAASAALTDVDTCNDEFGSGEPANLKVAIKKSEDLIDTLLVILNSL